MNFGKFDIYMIVGMVFSLIIMSILLSSLGISDGAVNTDNIPEYNISTNTFNFVSEPPDQPRSAEVGELIWRANDNERTREHDKWLAYDGQYGEKLTFANLSSTPSRDTMAVTISKFNSTDSYGRTYYINLSDRMLITDFDYEITVEYAELQNDRDAIGTFKTHETPGGGFISNIPVLGEAYDTAQAIVSIIAWLGEIFIYYIVFIVELIINVLIAIFQIFQYVFTLITWMLSVFNTIIFNSTSFFAILMFIPIIILFLELLKITLIVVSVLPTT